MNPDQPDQPAAPVTIASGPRSPAWDRVKDVLALKPGVFADIAADTSATSQGFAVFAVASAVGGIWFFIFLPLTMALSLAIIALQSLLFMVVSRLFSDSVPDFGTWFRTLLFASAPGAFGLIPFIGWLISGFYGIIIGVLVVREIVKIGTAQAVLVLVISAVVPVILALFLIFSFAVNLAMLADL